MTASTLPRTLTQQIFERVSRAGMIEFRELESIPGFKGDESMCVFPNCAVWGDMSLEACEAVAALIDADIEGLALIPAPVTTRMLRTLVATKVPVAEWGQREFPDMHYLPVAIASAEFVKTNWDGPALRFKYNHSRQRYGNVGALQ